MCEKWLLTVVIFFFHMNELVVTPIKDQDTYTTARVHVCCHQMEHPLQAANLSYVY